LRTCFSSNLVHFALCAAAENGHREEAGCFPHASPSTTRGPDMKLHSKNRKAIARLALPADKAEAIHFDDKLPGFGLRLRRSGDHVRRSWVYQYRRAGGQRRMLLGNADVVDVAKARTAAEKAAAKVALGEDPQGDKAEQRQRDAHSL